MSRERRRSVRAALVALLALSGVAVVSAAAERAGAGDPAGRKTRAELARGRGPTELLAYQVSGVRDAAEAATVVHCTNLGAEIRTVFVDIYGFDGLFECTTQSEIAPDGTATLATRDTALYEEDDWCAEPPGTNQGSLDVWVTTSNSLICTIQVVDPAATTPRYVTTLDLFRR